MVKIGINGFGRIGRLVFRAICEQGLLGKEIEVVAVNDLVPADNLAYLVKYDSTQGRPGRSIPRRAAPTWRKTMSSSSTARINASSSAKAPSALPWKALGVDIVIESTGLFTERKQEIRQGHIDRRREEGHHLRSRQGRRHHGRHGREP
jgi:glyceraldehyde 3-phosphate dehydrogenase